ncbi:MAG: histidine kinase [Chitinophagaceae bacterium]|nr:histidine kinase [Chitinophagaceae bacterium]
MTTQRKISNYWLCQLVGWGIVGISFLFYANFYKIEIDFDYLQKVFYIITAGLLSTHLLRWYMKKNNWLLLPVEKIIFRLIIAVLLTSVLYSALVLVLDQVTGLDENRRNLAFTTRLFANMLNVGMLIVPWVLFYYFYHYIVKSRRQQLDTLKLEALVRELELKTIKAHINPHFIFNALNSIRALIDENPGRARNAVTHLSNILRSSMQAEKLETVPLERELSIVKDYLALEYIRFEDRLKVEYDVNNDTLTQPVPPMMLQTLVENAIKHGISDQLNGGLVKVTSDFKNDYHRMTVQNSGLLNGHANADGFGLSSTRNRLDLLFGGKASFEISQEGELVVAKVLIPVT